MNIKETEELARFLSRLANSIDKTLSDGSVTVSDVQYLFSPLAAAKPAIEGISKVDNELLDLDAEEATYLVDVFAQELDLSNDVSETLTEEGLALSIALVQFVNKVRAARGIE